MTLTRGARITGAVLSAVLAVYVAGWIVRDFGAVGEPLDLLRYWAGYADARPDVMPATAQGDVVLFIVYVLTAIAATRSPVAASALVATGVVTLALRVPGLWIIGASWMEGRYPDELRTRALIGTFVVLAAGIALIITGAAGRRPADAREPRPTRPGQGASVTAFLVLGAAGAVLIAWEIRQVITFPSSVRSDWFTGGHAVRVELIGAPPGWGNIALALLCLVVAFTALFHAVHARPLGMTAAGFLLTGGSLGIARSVHHELLGHFGELGTEIQLTVLTSFFLACAGAAALIALARRGVQDTPGDGNQGYGTGYGPGYGGYGYPQQPGPGGGYGYPQGPGQAPGQAPGQVPGQGPAPGYGYPQGSGFGPPPPSSPPPGW